MICVYTYRFLVPFVGQVKSNTVDYKQSVNYHEKVMGIPEGIESSELFQKVR